jgi:hypothetical protein
LPVTFVATFTGLGATSHTVEIFASVPGGGTVNNVYYDAGCWSTSNLTVKEFY